MEKPGPYDAAIIDAHGLIDALTPLDLQ